MKERPKKGIKKLIENRIINCLIENVVFFRREKQPDNKNIMLISMNIVAIKYAPLLSLSSCLIAVFTSSMSIMFFKLS